MRRGVAGDGRPGSHSEEPAERHLRLGLLAAGIVLILGTAGLSFVEHLSPLDALYDTVGLMTTYGGFESPRSAAGRALATLILVAGVGALFYTFGALAEYFIEGHFGRTIGRHRMERNIERLRDHAIICGFGRVGRRIAREFASVGQPFVVVDPREVNAQALEVVGYVYVQADATMDSALLRAGVQRARSLLVATDSDAENIAITLSARALAPDIWIVARSNQDETEHKLIRAGANRVLSPYVRAGHRMAVLARRPALSDFVDAALQEGEPELALEELQVGEGSPLVGMQLPFGPGEAPKLLNDRLILAMRRAGTSDWMTVPWRPGTIVRPGDCLIVLASEPLMQVESESEVRWEQAEQSAAEGGEAR
ncbi:MAG: potassium channel family protein [Ktedonobacterales bacterium]